MKATTHVYETIPTYPSKRDRREGVLHMVVETTKGSPYKFALDVMRGLIAMNEVLPAHYTWPFDYGFIPGTLGDDGDPLDILILLDTPTFSGCLLRGRLLGAIRIKKNGVENDRFVAAPQRMPGRPLATDAYETLSDVPASRRKELESFLRGYSEGEGNTIEIVGDVDRDDALELIRKGRKKFRRGN